MSAELLLKVEREEDGEFLIEIGEDVEPPVLIRVLGAVLGVLHLNDARFGGHLQALEIEALGQSLAQIMSEANRVLDSAAAGDWTTQQLPPEPPP